MPTLNWIGKDKVLAHHQEVPYHILDSEYTYNAATSGNLIIHGDNLTALKSLLPQYECRIKCIYIDPPYNTGNEGWAYNDRVNDPKILKWLHSVVGKGGEDLSRHDKWLCMMYPRLRLLHKLLAPDGAIFISIDDNEQVHLKLMMNEIFGSGNFRNCIAVRRGIKNVQAQFKDVAALSVGHEYIYLYSKSPGYRLPKLSKIFEEGKAGKWDTFWRGTDRPTMRYELFGENPEKGQWRWEKGRAMKAAANYQAFLQLSSEREIGIDDYYSDHLTATNEKIDFIRKNEAGVVQYYVPPQDAKLLSDNWMDVSMTGSVTSFDTEKSVAIVERIVSWICPPDKDSIILDSFAGSGTTAHAVLNLNQRDGGHRKFILIEMEAYAGPLTAERVKRVIDGYGTQEGTGGSFTYATVGAPLFHANNTLNEAVPVARIREYIWYSETATPLRDQSRKTKDERPDTAEREAYNCEASPTLQAVQRAASNPYFLGSKDDSAYYFYYEPDALTTLDDAFLSTISHRAATYIIYADTCLLSKPFMQAKGIIFKKIPRDITRF